MSSAFITPYSDSRFTWLCLRDHGGGKCIPITAIIASFLGLESAAIGQAIYFQHSESALIVSCLLAGLVFLVCGGLFFNVVRNKPPVIPFHAV